MEDEYFESSTKYFASIQITSLNVNDDFIDIKKIIYLLKFLPNLSSLKVSLESFGNEVLQSLKQTQDFLSVSMNNKITKVKLMEFAEDEFIRFWIDLCPNMNYLEIDCQNEYDIERIVKTIRNYSCQLKFLCFNIPTVDKKPTKHLRKIIDY